MECSLGRQAAAHMLGGQDTRETCFSPAACGLAATALTQIAISVSLILPFCPRPERLRAWTLTLRMPVLIIAGRDLSVAGTENDMNVEYHFSPSAPPNRPLAVPDCNPPILCTCSYLSPSPERACQPKGHWVANKSIDQCPPDRLAVPWSMVDSSSGEIVHGGNNSVPAVVEEKRSPFHHPAG